MSFVIDLNADLGEGSGRSRLAEDEALLSLVSSANIACGAHAGDDVTIADTIRIARDRGVAIGAHPSYPDREAFGRRDMEIPAEALEQALVEQIERLANACVAGGTKLRYVKPHGALYNRATRDRAIADVIAQSIIAVDSSLVLLGLAGNQMLDSAREAGLVTAAEAFADRGYMDDGTLVPRGQSGALLEDPAGVTSRATRLVKECTLASRDGKTLSITADSLCTHGDGPNAHAILRALRDGLERSGVTIAPFAR